MTKENCEICEWLDEREKSARKYNTDLIPINQLRITHRQQFHREEG